MDYSNTEYRVRDLPISSDNPVKIKNKKKTQNISQPKVFILQNVQTSVQENSKVQCVLAEKETREREAGEASHLYSTKHSLNIKHLKKLHI